MGSSGPISYNSTGTVCREDNQIPQEDYG